MPMKYGVLIFFWTKNLKVDENELKKVSEKVMRLEENKKEIN